MTDGYAAPALGEVGKVPSKAAVWVGWIISVLIALLMLFSATMKFVQGEAVAKGFEHLGWPMHMAVGLGILEAGCAIIYLMPRVAGIGAILMTGYLGGAIATHLRIGEPPVMEVILAMLVWLGLFLRNMRVRAIIPLMR